MGMKRYRVNKPTRIPNAILETQFLLLQDHWDSSRLASTLIIDGHDPHPCLAASKLRQVSKFVWLL